VECYLKAGDVKAAVNCCILLNQWQKALQLAETHNFPQVDGLFTRYVGQLLAEDQRLLAVDVYRRADRAADAAMLLADIAHDVVKNHADPKLAKVQLTVYAHFASRARRKY
jgi:WD repeat-containing protein 35